MRNIYLLLTLVSMAFLFGACQSVDTMNDVVDAKIGTDSVIVHITADPNTPDGLHRVSMGLNFAKMAQNEGKKVLIFFSIDGVLVSLEETEDMVYESNDFTFPAIKTNLQDLMNNGARVMVCPGCLAAAGYNNDDLIKGIELGDIKGFFELSKTTPLVMTW